MWLLKNLGRKALDWAHDKWGSKAKGLIMNDNMCIDQDNDDCVSTYSFKRGRDSSFADIEQNPGPVGETTCADETG